MSPFSALALYPLWSLALAAGLVTLRLRRATGTGLVALCIAMAAWVTGLLLLESGAAAWAERLLPSGMMLAGAFVHAAGDVAGVRHRALRPAAWAFALAVSAVGWLAPDQLYGPGARGMGPLFVPLAIFSALASSIITLWVLRLFMTAAPGRERRRRAALFVAHICGALGGGGTIALYVFDLAPIGVGAPFLFVSAAATTYAVWESEDLRGQRLLGQAFSFALTTAAFSGLALPLFTWLLPRLTPDATVLSPWGVLVCFLAALPLDPLRQLLVDQTMALVFRRPITVGALAAEVERQEARAEQSERLAEIGRISSAVAHEIRNPLGVILAEAKILEQSGAEVESVQAIRTQVQRASRFLEDLLRYAKPRPLALEEVELSALALEAAENARRALSAAPERLELSGAEARIHADRAAVVDVLTNLIGNALIAVEERPAARVRVEVEALADAARTIVSDDGPGVPPAIAERLFLPFVTGRGRDARHPGTGLGLALAARLVERHGGSIRHERPAEGGARFLVTWPKRPPA